ncbi:unnamed protein product [Dovyalis caffra]|uniref:Uncharacterized protein n=1 Tax=Dovyalis caffra TaxID=77055 RepID=A0AAV1SR52_9ROSI|nr:unnamed protein product [Dovyalis caffra]
MTGMVQRIQADKTCVYILDQNPAISDLQCYLLDLLAQNICGQAMRLMMLYIRQEMFLDFLKLSRTLYNYPVDLGLVGRTIRQGMVR